MRARGRTTGESRTPNFIRVFSDHLSVHQAGNKLPESRDQVRTRFAELELPLRHRYQ